MDFHIGDQVIHSSFGFGEITKIEEKRINGHLKNYYVVSINNMTVWVPIDDGHSSLRIPTPPDEFLKTLPILTSPQQDLQEDRVLRKKQLLDQLKDGQLASICRVIRDLTGYQSKTKLNDQEKSILERAIRSLLTEWTISLGTPPNQAHQAMESMLHN
jgi:CarD family transcriptional regulator